MAQPEQWKLVANNDMNYTELYQIRDDPYEKVELQDDEPDCIRTLVICEQENNVGTFSECTNSRQQK